MKKSSLAFTAVLVLPLALLGCTSSRPSEQALREMVTDAASVPGKVWRPFHVAGLIPTIKRVDDHRFTLVILEQPSLDLEPKVLTHREQLKRELRYVGREHSDPQILSLAGSEIPGTDRVCVFHTSHLQSLSCKIRESMLFGVMSFRTPILAGQFEYTAMLTNHHWQVTQFRLPVRGIEATLTTNGTWHSTGCVPRSTYRKAKLPNQSMEHDKQ